MDRSKYKTTGIGERPTDNPSLILMFSGRELLEAVYEYGARKGRIPEGGYVGWLTVDPDASTTLELWCTNGVAK